MDLTDRHQANNADEGRRLAAPSAAPPPGGAPAGREAAGGQAARHRWTGQELWFGASAQAGANFERVEGFIERELSRRGWGWLLTGTFKRPQSNPYRVIKVFRQDICKFFRGRDFFGCAEQHASEYWHTHAIIGPDVPRHAVERFCYYWGFDNRQLHLRGDEWKSCLRYGKADVREIARGQDEDVKRVVSYVCKYLVKQFPGRRLTREGHGQRNEAGNELWFCSLANGERRRQRDAAAAEERYRQAVADGNAAAAEWAAMEFQDVHLEADRPGKIAWLVKKHGEVPGLL